MLCDLTPFAVAIGIIPSAALRDGRTPRRARKAVKAGQMDRDFYGKDED